MQKQFIYDVCFLTCRLMTYNGSVLNHLNRSVCKSTLTARIRVESASLSDNTTRNVHGCYTGTRSMSTRLVTTWNAATFRLPLQTEILIGTNLQSFFVAGMIGWLAHHTSCDGKKGTYNSFNKERTPTKISVTLTFGKCRCRVIAPTQIRTIVCYPLKKRSKLHTNRKRRYLFVQQPLLYRV